MKSARVIEAPYTWLVSDLLKRRLKEKQTIIIAEEVIMKAGTGEKQSPDTIPAHNGTIIRRNGISL
jgi:hypothetical protein